MHLVADTNLFFECKSLGELPWTELGHDPVVIILTKPILDEIDKHKKANGRTRSRALEIFSRVRDMLKSSTQEIEIRPSSPKVLLRLMANVRPDPALKEDLDYTKTDEKLIGIVSTLCAQAADNGVRLFTDDTGPAAIADGLAIPYLMIEKDWRRPPSESTEEKKIRDLEKDLATYRTLEPEISIAVCDPADESNVVNVTRRVPTPLTETEVSELLAVLRQKHALVTDFTPPSPSRTTGLFGEIATTTFTAPAENDITNYRDVLYPGWIEECRKILANLHKNQAEIEPPTLLRWSMSNDGTRPASHVRIEFEAKGPLVLRRLPADGSGPEATDTPAKLTVASTPRLPPAPKPPPFQKQVIRVPSPGESKLVRAGDISALHASAISRLQASVLGSSGLAELAGRSIAGTILPRPIEKFEIPTPYIPPRHDPEGFYYDWPATRKVKKGALTCGLWRHQTGKETFEFEVLFTKFGEAYGIVECTVHAENLTKPAQSKLKIERNIEPLSMMKLATEMVETSS